MSLDDPNRRRYAGNPHSPAVTTPASLWPATECSCGEWVKPIPCGEDWAAADTNGRTWLYDLRNPHDYRIWEYLFHQNGWSWTEAARRSLTGEYRWYSTHEARHDLRGGLPVHWHKVVFPAFDVVPEHCGMPMRWAPPGHWACRGRKTAPVRRGRRGTIELGEPCGHRA